jgi:predicted TIM-barrel fold metal-dependent hydrolase
VSDLPFTDTHVHFWDRDESGLRYAWLEPDGDPDPDLGDYGAIKSQRYLPEDFTAETRFAGVRKVIHVQAAVGMEDPVAETQWVQRMHASRGVPHAIVAAADLSRPDALNILERQAAFPAVRAVRDLRYDGYLTDPVWQRGYAHLARFGLICCDDPAVEDMTAAAELARRHPETIYCVDHAGFPRRRDPEYFRAWRSGMRGIAAVENTVVKVSGLGMGDPAWTVDSLRPWVVECIDAWGVERAFFGSNWPVDRLFSSYGDVIDTYRELIGDLHEREQRALLSGNADRVFGLGG